MKFEEQKTEAGAGAALALSTAAPMVMDMDGTPVLLVPEGWQKVDTNYEKYLPTPRRKSGVAALATVESLARFIALRDEGDTEVLTYRAHFALAATFNPNTKDGAGWGDDGARVQFQLDHCLKKWKELAGRWLTQAQFSDFLRERGVDIIEPDAGSVLDLVENLETHTNVKGKFSRRAQDGSSTILWEEDVQASTKVPEKFILRLPCFLLSETQFEVECRLCFRAKDGMLHWQFLIDEFETAMDQAWDAELDKFRNHAALPADVKERIFAAA